MITALELARYGISALILDDDNKFADGSRAIAMHNSILEVFERNDCLEPMLEKATVWNLRRTFYRQHQIFLQQMPPLQPHTLPTFVNLQQSYTEEYLYHRIAADPLVQLLWEHEVTGIQQDDEAVTLTVDTPEGVREFRGAYVIACDGARSACRKMLNLPFPGHSHADSFLIADIRADLPFERQPRFFFDHPTNPGSTILIHPQPDGVWRIDWQVGAEVDIEQEKQPGRINQRIQSLIGEDVPYEIVWLSDYRFHQRMLEKFQHGRVFFAGDSAHLVAPFGARGMNSGVLDGENLAWKLWLVMKGLAHPDLLHTYDAERWPAQKENQIVTDTTMRFMVPPTRWHRLRRNIILRLSARYPFARRWVDSGKMAVPFTYLDSVLNIPDSDAASTWQKAPVLGCKVPDAPLKLGAETLPLRQFLNNSFLALFYAPTEDELKTLIETLAQANSRLPISLMVVLDADAAPRQTKNELTAELFNSSKYIQSITSVQDTGEFVEMYQAAPGSLYLLRPDRHLSARLRPVTPQTIQNMLDEAARRYFLNSA